MEALKGIGAAILGLGILVGLLVIAVFSIYGIAWASVKVYEYVLVVNSFAFLVSLFVLLPCAIFRPTRKIAAFGLFGASFIFGLTVWIYGFLVTYATWGLFG